MGLRTVFQRSPLASRVRSPLGSFEGHSEQFMEIFTVPIFMLDGETYSITGELFGASQGAGLVEIANTPEFDDVVVTQTIDTWSDTDIAFDFVDTNLPESGPVWIKVTNDDGETDVAISSTSAISDTLAMLVRNWGEADYFCNLSGWYCTLDVGVLGDLNNTGYNTADLFTDFYGTTPGFYLIGGTSLKVVEYGHHTAIVTGGLGRSVSWCASDEGLASFYYDNDFTVLYDADGVTSETSCIDDHGWTTGETVYLVPKYPVSIQITDPPTPTSSAPLGTDVTLAAYSFAAEGDISADIRWYDYAEDPPALLYTGETFIYSDMPIGGLLIIAQIANAHGQTRSAEVEISATVPAITLVFPPIGNTAGGQRLTIIGNDFTVTSTVEVGGNAATSVVFIDSTTLQCIVPAGTGVDDVVVDVDGYQATLEGEFTYTSAANISVTSITPDTGSTAGGTSVSIAGTGFTADCIVGFMSVLGGDTELATSVVVVSDILITCDSPAWSFGAGLVDVAVADGVTGAGDILLDGFEYT